MTDVGRNSLTEGEVLMYADLNPDSRRRYPVETTPDAIHAAEERGLVAPDPQTFARRLQILEKCV